MTHSLIKVGVTLPTIPLGWVHPLEGRNVVLSDLIKHNKYDTAESVIARFRTINSPAQQPHFRRYYLKARKQTRGVHRIYSLWYVPNTKNQRDDQFVGKVVGDDIEMAIVMIGNHVSRCKMSSISWMLCEDRDGIDVIENGRYDPWSLLVNIDEHDLSRIASKGIVPNITDWDFDNMWWIKNCQRCNESFSVLAMAFNIDSAVCSTCGNRPFLSGAIHQYMKTSISVSTTNNGNQLINPKDVFAAAIEWMGGVNASPTEVEPTVHKELLTLANQSGIFLPEGTNGELMHAVKNALITVCESDARIGEHAAKELMETIRSGKRLNNVHAATARLLQAAAKQSGVRLLLDNS